MKPHRTNGSSKLVGLREAAEEYGLAYGTLRALVVRGEIPHLRLGRTILVRRAAVDAFLNATEQTGVA